MGFPDSCSTHPPLASPPMVCIFLQEAAFTATGSPATKALLHPFSGFMALHCLGTYAQFPVSHAALSDALSPSWPVNFWRVLLNSVQHSDWSPEPRTFHHSAPRLPEKRVHWCWRPPVAMRKIVPFSGTDFFGFPPFVRVELNEAQSFWVAPQGEAGRVWKQRASPANNLPQGPG